ncbi:NAC domain-containing protein 60-like [Quercus robur]|uniref:NAC domain-containing protein 60-like n=1 Tax=Quercus robur TaxID=38942 RepID=UPI0021619870|nr:NAC domain-containing protein 60-like [Quercus robur]
MKKLSLKLPSGYRFSPTEQEIIERFLKSKITGNDKDINHVPEIEFYDHEPWDLQHISGIDSKDKEWFFFNAQSPKHQNGNRKNRTTMEGFWKATGKDREIRSRGSLIGMKKTLVYHRGRTPNGEGTKWVMHEYRITQEEFDGTHPGQKPFVVCRLFNNEEKSKKGGSAKSKPALAPLSPASEVQVETLQTSIQSCYSEISDEMMSDVTLPVQSNNNYHNADIAKNQAAELTYTEDYSNVAEFLNMSNVQSLGDTPSSLSPIAPDVLTPNISEDSTFINPLNNQDECFYNTSCSQNNLAVDIETLKNNGSCGGSDANGQVDLDLDIWEAFERGYISPPGQSECNSFFSPSNSTPVTPVVSPRTIAKAPLKEAESMVPPASVPRELGFEAENYLTSSRFSPAKNYDGITSNAKTPIEYKNDGYNTYVDRNQVEEVTSDKVEARSNMFSVSPEPLIGNMLSPFHSQVQGALYSSANDCHWGVYNQYGTNEQDEYFRNASLSQNNLAVDDETLKNMASFMDNGPCSGSGANAQSEQEYQGFVRLEEIIKPKVSSSL